MRFVAPLLLTSALMGCTVMSEGGPPPQKLKPASAESLAACPDLPNIPPSSEEIKPKVRNDYYIKSRTMFVECQLKQEYLAKREKIIIGGK